MRGRCYKCGDDQEFVEAPPRQILHAIPQLNSPIQIDVPRLCTNCGYEVSTRIRFVHTNRSAFHSAHAPDQPAPRRQPALILGSMNEGSTSLSYSGVCSQGQNVMFPEHEGRLSAGRAIDRHGDPDLMAEFSAEYLRQYWTIVPQGRLPKTISEMMPALHLLLNAAELALKADLIRSDKDSGGHSLDELYDSLDCSHKRETERRFAETAFCAHLSALGINHPTVKSVLRVYQYGFGWSSVYQNTRYFAEPTTRVKSQSAKGGNLVKSVPYPIFLPLLVQTILDVYAFFTGAERMRRLGAQVEYDSRDPGSDQHGEWSLVPSSVGLIVIRVAQLVAQDEHGRLRDAFRRFKETRPPAYCTSWMYGGSKLLFFRVGAGHPEDGERVIDGVECKVWHDGKLGMHSRDLYLLANVLAAGDLAEFDWAMPHDN